MRIAMISDHASPLAQLGSIDSGGQNVYVTKLSEALAEAGHYVDIFTRRDDPNQAAITYLTSHIRVVQVPAGPPQFIPKEELLPFMDSFRNYMLQFISQHSIEYDLIHAHFFMSAKVAVELKHLLKIPVIITFHALGKIRRQFLKTNDRFPKNRPVIETLAIQNSDAIIAECPQDKQDLLKLYNAPPEKIHLIPCGVDTSELYPLNPSDAKKKLGLNEDTHYILQLGRMVPRKGISTVIAGYKQFNLQSQLKTQLLIVGGDGITLDPSPSIRFIYQQSRSRLKYFYNAADVFVSLPWYEPFGITPLEAMACARPVIGSRVGGVKYSVVHHKTGILIPPKNPQELAKALHQIMFQPALQSQYGTAGLARVKKMFTWKKVAKQMTHVYRKAVTDYRKGEIYAFISTQQ